MDLWWSGKHACHGGNIQVVAAPDGWPLWTSPVRPAREHDTTALRAHGKALPLLAAWTNERRRLRTTIAVTVTTLIVTVVLAVAALSNGGRR